MNDDHHDNHEDQPDSLLKRLLNEEAESRIPDEDDTATHSPDNRVSPIPGVTAPAQPPDVEDSAPVERVSMSGDDSPLSPIRPTVPENHHFRPLSPMTPTPPDRTPPERQLTPREKMQRAEEALINLRHKTALVAAEFAEGKLNQAQFDAIYSRYSEQRAIIERLLTRDPQSQAWQSVARPGHTQFLKQHYAARPLSYAIYDQNTFTQVAVTGVLQIRVEHILAVLERLRSVIQRRGNPGPAQKNLPDGKCILIVPGELTVAVVVFSLEPATRQIERIRDIHTDFERANRRALNRGDYDISRMVFPHRALFETGSLG